MDADNVNDLLADKGTANDGVAKENAAKFTAIKMLKIIFFIKTSLKLDYLLLIDAVCKFLLCVIASPNAFCRDEAISLINKPACRDCFVAISAPRNDTKLAHGVN